MAPELQPSEDRFWSRVDVGAPSECWIWKAGYQSAGYGEFTIPGIGKQLAHRVAYELGVGEIPSRHFVSHLCEHSGCCNPHHLEARQSPLKRKPLEYRLWDKVDIRDPDECWPWKSSTKTAFGYGQLTVDGKPALAHRLAYELSVGQIPRGQWVLHRCDNPACCNPNHLFLGTHTDNMRDMNRKLRGASTRYPGLRRGENNGNARLCEDDVRGIRQRVSAGASRKEVAEEYGVSQFLVSDVVLRKTWRHVP